MRTHGLRHSCEGSLAQLKRMGLRLMQAALCCVGSFIGLTRLLASHGPGRACTGCCLGQVPREGRWRESHTAAAHSKVNTGDRHTSSTEGYAKCTYTSHRYSNL